MHRLTATAALLLALAAPAGARAADTTTPAPPPSPASAPSTAPALGGAWEIGAIEASGTTLHVDGKLGIGTDLTASVGCNSLSAPVTSFDGTRLVIGQVASTLIGCPPEQAQAEQMLAAILGAGSLTFDGRSLASSAGRIDFVGNQPVEPIATPPANPGVPVVDPATCSVLLGSEWDLGTPGVEPGAAGGSGGSSGSGSGSSGGNPVDVETSGPVVLPSAIPVPPNEVPSPIAVPTFEVPSPIAIAPPTQGPLETPNTATVDATPVAVPPIPQPLPAISVDPNASASVEPVPGATPSLVELCRGLLTQLKNGTLAIPPAVAAPIPGVESADQGYSAPASTADGRVVIGAIAILLVIVVGGVILGRRAWSRRHGGAQGPGA